MAQGESEPSPLLYQHALRDVIGRCLYGVDKNPRAVDLARLSLWLATLARDHEFTFLDHALKCGDSLVGLTTAQIAAATWDDSKPALPLFRQLEKERVTEAMKARAEIQAAPDDTRRAIQEARHHALEGRLAPIRTMGDAVVAARDASGLHNEAAWVALERKGLLKSMFPMAAVLTPSGLGYDTGLADKILHRHAGH